MHRFRIYYASLERRESEDGEWAPGVTATNAKYAAQDSDDDRLPRRLRLGGDRGLAAARSTRAGILQVSPASPYVGSDLLAATPARTSPNASTRPASARSRACCPATRCRRRRRCELMRDAGDQARVRARGPGSVRHAARGDPRRRRQARGHRSRGRRHDRLDREHRIHRGGQEGRSKAARRRSSSAVTPGAGAVALWQQLHAADPHLRLLGSSSLSSEGSRAEVRRSVDRLVAVAGRPRRHGRARRYACEPRFVARSARRRRRIWRARCCRARSIRPRARGARAVPRAVPRSRGPLRAGGLRDDERDAARDPPGGLARQRPPDRDATSSSRSGTAIRCSAATRSQPTANTTLRATASTACVGGRLVFYRAFEGA